MNNLQARKPKKSIKTGDIFQLGEHILLCGDATNKALVTKSLHDKSINLILTDPPYGVNYVEGKKDLINHTNNHKNIQNDHFQTEEEYRIFTRQWLENVCPYLSLKNTVYIFNTDKMLCALREGMKEAGCYFSQLLIWIKNQAVMGRMDYLSQHELIAYGWYGRHKFFKSKDKSVLIYPKPQKSKLHPTMKPIGLLRRLILNSTKIGDSIYDPFGGSGSTLMAAEQTKRKCLMIELDPDYCQVIMDRFYKLTAIQSYHLNNIKI